MMDWLIRAEVQLIEGRWNLVYRTGSMTTQVRYRYMLGSNSNDQDALAYAIRLMGTELSPSDFKKVGEGHYVYEAPPPEAMFPEQPARSPDSIEPQA